jgi:hypothetical protein
VCLLNTRQIPSVFHLHQCHMLNPYFIPVCIFQFTLSIDGQPSLLFIVVARGGHCLIEMKQLGSSHSGNDLLLTCSVPMTLTRPLSRTKATLWWSLHLTPNFYQPYITTVWSFSDNQGLSSSSFFLSRRNNNYRSITQIDDRQLVISSQLYE